MTLTAPAPETILSHSIKGSKILLPGGPQAILVGDKEAEFLEGWHAVQAYTGLPPLVIVLFVSSSGTEGLWLLDSDFCYIANDVSNLPDSLASSLMAPLCSLVDELWTALMLSRGGKLLSRQAEAFFQLSQFCRDQLVTFYLNAFPASVRHHHCAAPGGVASRVPVIDCGGRRIPVRVGDLHALFDPFLLQRKQEILIETGRFDLPSILSESTLTCCKAFYLGPDLIVYRLFDEVWRTPILLLSGDIIFRVLAVYVPEANLVLSYDPSGSDSRWPTLMKDFFHHIALYGDSISVYLGVDGATPIHFWRGIGALHLGHLLWNDLSGIEDLVSRFKRKQLPRFMLCDTDAGPEMYGAFEHIFPELKGKVARHREPFLALVNSFYINNEILFRSSRLKVTAGLRDRILSLVPVRQRQSPVIVLGLRTENRTIVDLDGFCQWFVNYLASLTIDVTLVVDGHNKAASGRPIASNLEHQAKRPPIDEEMRLVGVMRAAAAGTSIEIVSTIGKSLNDSLSWCRDAAFFVALWGAGLAKYRWVCNTRGVVLTNAWNLDNLGDLRIYSEPLTMDAPTDVVFAPRQATKDRPDSPLLLSYSDRFEPNICNFEIDLKMLATCLDAQVAAWLPEALNARSRHAPPSRITIHASSAPVAVV